MKKLVRPASWLFYLLTIIAFFIGGVTYAILTDATKGQGLAGGAIVLGYGVIAAFVSLIVAMFVAYHVSYPVIIKFNRVLSALVAIGIVYTVYRYSSREGAAQTNTISPTLPYLPSP